MAIASFIAASITVTSIRKIPIERAASLSLRAAGQFNLPGDTMAQMD
jgi:hypothetical protein